MTALRSVRNDAESKLLIHICSKDRTFQCSRNNGRGEEQSLIERLADAKAGADLFSESRSCQTVCRSLHTVLPSDDIAADRGKSAARVLN